MTGFDKIHLPPHNFNGLGEVISTINHLNGFEVLKPDAWNNDHKIPSKLALIHSEVSEALEWFRQLDKEGYKLDDRIYTEEELYDKFPSLNDSEQFAETRSFFDFLEKYTKEDIKEEFGYDLADIIIRVLSLASGLGIDLDFLITRKLEKNMKRGFKHGGKKI